MDSAVSASTLTSTICRKGGYTSSVRPPASLTDPAKRQLMAAYGIPASEASKYELDHLIPLGVGGASHVRNLWPQPNTLVHQRPSKYVRNDKDALEGDSQAAICTSKAELTSLQKAFAADWTTINLAHTTPKRVGGSPGRKTRRPGRPREGGLQRLGLAKRPLR